MARNRDDDDRYDDEIDTPRRVDVAAARGKVAVPAVFLMLFGLLGLGLGLLSLVVAVTASDAVGDAYADFLKPLVEKQPPSRARDDQLAQIEQTRQNLRKLGDPLNLAFTALGTAVSGLVFVGGLRMKGLKSYWLAVAASIASFYPCGCVLCFAAPFGLWALITLLNGDVKAAFAAGGKLPPTLDRD